MSVVPVDKLDQVLHGQAGDRLGILPDPGEVGQMGGVEAAKQTVLQIVRKMASQHVLQQEGQFAVDAKKNPSTRG
jgi:hypothetical protein